MSTVIDRGRARASTSSADAATHVARPAAESSPPLPVTFDGLGRVFGTGTRQRTVLQDVNLTARAGTITALLGPSGCGKSTLLRIAAGLDRPTSGSVTIDGTAVHSFDPRCAVAFQEARLLPWRSVRNNVALGLPQGDKRGRGLDTVDRLLDLVGLSDSAGHRPREISGGMAQRASLARALARRPGVLLLDEPFGALDALTRIKMQDLLLEVHRAEPATVLLVTHDVAEAVRLADTVVVLGHPDGVTDPTAERKRAGATVLRTVDIDRTLRRDPVATAELRNELLDCLGVHQH